MLHGCRQFVFLMRELSCSINECNPLVYYNCKFYVIVDKFVMQVETALNWFRDKKGLVGSSVESEL